MKIILLQDIKGKGKKNEIKDIANGYAKYLITKSLAIPVTKGSVNKLNNQLKEETVLEKEKITKFENIKNKLEKETLIFYVKTGQQDQVFGTISTKQIVSKLQKKGYDIDKKKIQIKNLINTLGTTSININLYKNISATLKIKIEKEK